MSYTKEEALERLKWIRDTYSNRKGRPDKYDVEMAHQLADDVLLAVIGDSDLAHAYKAIERRYI